MIDWKPRAQALADQLFSEGHLRTRPWREVFAAVPRHEFVPCFFEQSTPGHWQRIDGTNADNQDRWLSAVYSNTTLVTSLQEVTMAGAFGHLDFAVAVSSSTEPGLMAQMLEDLDLHPGHTVLEIGTGTGYNAALLCRYTTGSPASVRLGTTRIDATSTSATSRVAHPLRQRHRLAVGGDHPSCITRRHQYKRHVPSHRVLLSRPDPEFIPPRRTEQRVARRQLFREMDRVARCAAPRRRRSRGRSAGRPPQVGAPR